MIPAQSFLALKWCLKIGSVIHAIPYKWSDDKGKLLCESNLRLFYSGKVLHFVHLLFLIVSFIWNQVIASGPGNDTKDTMLHSLLISFYLATNLLTLNVCMFRKESPLFLNSLLFFNSGQMNTDGGIRVTACKKDYFGTLLLTLLPTTALSASTSWLLLFIFSPNKPFYLYSFIKPEYQSWFLLIPFALNESFQACHAAFSAYFYVYSTLVSERCLTSWLRCLIHSTSNDRWFTRGRATAIVNLYRSLQVLKSLHSNALRWVVIPTVYGFSMVIMVFSGYASIRLYDVLPIYLYVVMPTVFTLLTIFCCLLHHSSSCVYQTSSRFIGSQTRRRGQPELRRVLRSLCCLKVEVGATYFVRNATAMEFAHIWATNTASVLLTFH